MENLEELKEYSKEGYEWVVFNDDGLFSPSTRVFKTEKQAVKHALELRPTWMHLYRDEPYDTTRITINFIDDEIRFREEEEE